MDEIKNKYFKDEKLIMIPKKLQAKLIMPLLEGIW